MNAIIIKEKKKAFPFVIKKENTDKIMAFKIFDERKITAKKLIKILEKEKIINVAFDNSISREFTEYFKGRLNIITKNDVLFSNIDKIIMKASGMLGIKDGKLSLGIIPGYKTDVLIKKLESTRSKLKILYILGEDAKENSYYADNFYNKTGVPVVICENEKNTECNILVYLGDEEILNPKYKGLIIDIFDKIYGRGVKDVKINFKDALNKYNISDGVLAKILGEPFNISGFITKNT